MVVGNAFLRQAPSEGVRAGSVSDGPFLPSLTLPARKEAAGADSRPGDEEPGATLAELAELAELTKLAELAE